MTAPIPSEAGWSAQNLPAELFRLEPPAGWGQARLQNLTVQGQAAQNIRPYKAFPIPPHISVNPEAFRLVMYGDRTDPRLTYRDLIYRMHPDQKHGLISMQAMSMQRTRFRDQLGLACWVKRTEFPSLNEMLKTEQYSLDSVRRNTSLPVKPWGLVRPVLEPGAFPVTPLPLDTFTGAGRVHAPSARLRMVYEEIGDLQGWAFNRGCPHWIFLPNWEKPDAWINRARAQHRTLTEPDDITFPDENSIPKDALAWIKECVVSAAAGQSGMIVPDLQTLPGHARGWVAKCVQEGQAMAASTTTTAIPSNLIHGGSAPTFHGGHDEGYKTASNDIAVQYHGNNDIKQDEILRNGEDSGWINFNVLGDARSKDGNGKPPGSKNRLLKPVFDEEVFTDDMADEAIPTTTSTQIQSHAVEATKPAVTNRVHEWLAATEYSGEQLEDNPPRSRKRAREPALESWSTAKRPRASQDATGQDQIGYLQPAQGLGLGFQGGVRCPGPSYDNIDGHKTNPRKRGRDQDLEIPSPAKRPRISNSSANSRTPEIDAQPLFKPNNEPAFDQPCSISSEVLLQAISGDVDLPSFGIPSAANEALRTEAPSTSQNALNQQSEDPVMGEWWQGSENFQFDNLFLCEVWPNCQGPPNCQNCRWDF